MENETVLALTSCLLIIIRRQQLLTAKNKKKKTRFWARRWLLRRDSGRGISNLMFREIKFEDPASFKNFCRMSSNAFDELLFKVEPLLKRSDTQLRECLSVKTRLLVTLRYLATGESFRSLGYYFRISVPSLSKCIPETVDAIYAVLKPDYSKTPTNKYEWIKIADRFEKEWNFPMCLGSFDGKHIDFRARKADGSYYFNYKHFNSIILMALVDADYNFIYVDVGCNGRASDGGIYNNSSLCKAIENNLLDIPEDAVLPKSNIKVPYRRSKMQIA